MSLGLPVGYDSEKLHNQGYPGWGTVQVAVLSALILALTSLTVGLVRRWSVVAPRWLPAIGGKPLSPGVVVGVATSGAAAVTLLTWSQLVVWFTIDTGGRGDGELAGTARTVIGLCYAPLLLWGPLLGAVTISYHRRHRRSALAACRAGDEDSERGDASGRESMLQP